MGRKQVHGMCDTKVYRAWADMKGRCYNIKHINYKYYGLKGVKVCDRWNNSFESFYQDMGDPQPGMSLDRINVYGDYEPSNCRWSNRVVQNHNMRKKCNTSSNYRGVYYHKASKRYMARIKVYGKDLYIGRFDNELDAAKAYDLKAIEVHGEYANTNFNR